MNYPGQTHLSSAARISAKSTKRGKSMFTTTELKSIDQTYFHIINVGCYSVTLQSKNTKHYWHILHQQYPKFTSCKIQHKHHFANQFHDQGNAPSLKQAIDEIKDHDYFHLHVRPLKKKHVKKCA